jgi:hypothetical protein
MTYQAAIPDKKICYPATPPPDSTPHVKPKQGGVERLLLAFAHLKQQQRYLTVISGSIDDAKYLVEGAIIKLRHPFFLHNITTILTGEKMLLCLSEHGRWRKNDLLYRIIVL